MSIIEILTYFMEIVFLFASIAFARYKIENVRFTRGGIGRRFMAFGAVCIVISAIVEITIFFSLQNIASLAYIAVVIQIAGFTLLFTGQVLQANTVKKLHGSFFDVLMFPRANWAVLGVVVLLFFGIPVSLLNLLQPSTPGLSWYSVGNAGIWAFAFVSLVISERRTYLAVSRSTEVKVSRNLMLRNDIQLVRAYSKITNELLARMGSAIGVVGIRNILARCVEEHPILLIGLELKAGLLDLKALIKNLDRIHETERLQELIRTFSDFNVKLIDLYSAAVSPVRAAEVVVAAAEATLDEAVMLAERLPLGKYNELIYNSEIFLRLPEGVADEEKARNSAYLLFKRVLEPILKKCKRATIKKIQGDLERFMKGPATARVKILDDGTIDLSGLYERLYDSKIEKGMQEAMKTFSTVMNSCYQPIKDDIGAERVSAILSEAFSGLLRRHGGLLLRLGITNIIPKDIEIPITYRPTVLGKSYLIEGQSLDQAFKMFAEVVRYGSPGLLISTSRPDDVRRDHELPDQTTVLWLSKIELDYSVSPSNLAILRDRITAFVSRNKNAAVMLEGLEYLMTTNGFDLALKLMHDIREAVVINRARFIVPVNPGALESKQLEMLRRYMEVIEVKEEES